jgi:uncharacterized protein (DUF58 family)
MSETLLSSGTLRRLEQLALVSRKLSTARQKGERRSRRRGTSTDFADWRNYVAGDDIRFLDWKLYGRLERLFTKLFLEEEDLRVTILVDVSASMGFGVPTKLDYARHVAAALGYVCLARTDSLCVRTFGEGLKASYGPRRGKANAASLLRFLADLETARGTGLARSFRSFAGGTRVRGMVVVLSDFYDFDGYEEAFRSLFGGNFEVLAVHILSPEELKPAHQGDVRFVDAEAEVTADVSMGRQAHEAYARTLSAFCGGMKSYITGRGGHYLLTSTETPFDRFVLDVLRRKGIVR